MKNILTFFIYPLLGCIAIYLLTSFGVWDLNPANWSIELRTSIAFTMLFIYILIIAVRNLS